MKRKSIYLLLLTCCVSMLALAGAENCMQKKQSAEQCTPAKMKIMPDLLSPLYPLLTSHI